jgi:Ser/Thr protein kinase RdoA (MazF antagonist)
MAGMAADLDAFMATMVTRSPPISLEQAVALVEEHYGLAVHARPLSGERDQNVRLTSADGDEYVLKIAHAAESFVVTEFGITLLQHIGRTDPELPCPMVRRTRRGATTFRFADQAGAARTGYVLSFLPGTPLGTVARSAQQRIACGRMAARLMRALQGFDHAGAHRALIWDVRRIARVRPLLAQLHEFPGRNAADELLAALIPRIEARLSTLRHQVVHNDLNPLNILVDTTDAARIVGIIDFGDAAYTAIATDVAVVAAEQIPDDASADGRSAREAAGEVASAYDALMPLTAAENELLGALMAARLVTNLVVQQWHLERNPASRHYSPLDVGFIHTRLAIAHSMLEWQLR